MDFCWPKCPVGVNFDNFVVVDQLQRSVHFFRKFVSEGIVKKEISSVFRCVLGSHVGNLLLLRHSNTKI